MRICKTPSWLQKLIWERMRQDSSALSELISGIDDLRLRGPNGHIILAKPLGHSLAQSNLMSIDSRTVIRISAIACFERCGRVLLKMFWRYSLLQTNRPWSHNLAQPGLLVHRMHKIRIAANKNINSTPSNGFVELLCAKIAAYKHARKCQALPRCFGVYSLENESAPAANS